MTRAQILFTKKFVSADSCFNVITMPKRKRDGSVQASYNPTDTSEEALKARRPLVKQKIDHGKKTLVRALKLAKGFERQKLGRRYKAAAQKNEEKELARLDAEIEALKVWVASLRFLGQSHLTDPGCFVIDLGLSEPCRIPFIQDAA